MSLSTHLLTLFSFRDVIRIDPAGPKTRLSCPHERWHFPSRSGWALLAGFSPGRSLPDARAVDPARLLHQRVDISLGLLLQRPLRANILLKSPLSSLLLPALMTMMLSWPIIIVTSLSNKTVVPLTLAIGMGLHWPAIGWLYGSRTCLLHAPVRAVLVTTCWFCLPDERFTVLPLVVAVVYVVSVWGLRREVNLARQRTGYLDVESI